MRIFKGTSQMLWQMNINNALKFCSMIILKFDSNVLKVLSFGTVVLNKVYLDVGLLSGQCNYPLTM